jgi:hypothetical protein
MLLWSSIFRSETNVPGTYFTNQGVTHVQELSTPVVVLVDIFHIFKEFGSNLSMNK